MTLKDKVVELVKLRSQIEEMKDAIKPFQAQRDELQDNIVKNMVKQGFDSVKTGIGTISKSIRKTMVIRDEDALVSGLKKLGLKEMVKERVNGDLWGSFSREAVKQGKELAGTELKETEYISIRQRKEEKKND